MRSFLILHGWQGSGPDHWQTWLAGRLTERGETVSYPDLPEPDTPDADDWAEAILSELRALPERPTVVCHSLACLLWAREAAAIAEAAPAGRLLLVAPPCPVSPIKGVRRLYPTPLDPSAVAASAREATVVGSDRDPYCPAGPKRSFAEPLALPIVILEGTGHINTEAGFGPWPAVEAWCVDGARLDAQGAKNGVET